MTNYTNISKSDYKMIIGLDFTQPVFMHAVLHAQGFITGSLSWTVDSTYLENLF